MRQEYERCKRMVEEGLEKHFTGSVPYKRLLESMRYSLLAGGKRVRPVMLLKFCEAAGGNMEDALPYACAVEMLHTYSLIHDDLPCMDDDDIRRGKPTNHVVFGEYTAVLAGDALQAAAFRTLLSSWKNPAITLVAGELLARAAGETGICGGQLLDMSSQGRDLTIEDLTRTHNLKTASMLCAAASIGVLAAGSWDTPEQIDAATAYAAAVGLAFQIRDDVLDCTATTEELGKSADSDARSGKPTFATLLGIKACEELILEKTEEAKNAVRGKFKDTAFLEWLADELATRSK